LRGVAVAYGPVLDPKSSWGVAIMEPEAQAHAESIAANDPAARSGMQIESVSDGRIDKARSN
jgi:hypothetical protein